MKPLQTSQELEIQIGTLKTALEVTNAQITQLEASCAAMRQALESVVGHANRRQLIATEGTEDPELHRLDEPDFVLLCKQALSPDAGKSLLDRLKDAEFKLKTYAMFRLRCDKCGDLFNEHHQGDTCPGSFYKNCDGTLQLNLPEVVRSELDRLQAVEAERDRLLGFGWKAQFQLTEVSKACCDIIGWDEIDADEVNKIINLGKEALQPAQKEQ